MNEPNQPEAVQGPYPLPQPSELTATEKESGMSAYLMMFASYFLLGLPIPWLNFIASWIYWGVNRRKSRFVAFHAWQNLWANFFTSLLNSGWLAWVIVALVKGRWTPAFFAGTAVILVFNVAYMVSGVIGAVKANKGLVYYQLVFGRMAYDKYYGPKALPLAGPAAQNRPPSGY